MKMMSLGNENMIFVSKYGIPYIHLLIISLGIEYYGYYGYGDSKNEPK